MGNSILRPLVAQALIVIMAVVLFTGVLTIVGSVLTSDVPEHALRNTNATITPGPEGGLIPIPTSLPEPADDLVIGVTPLPGSETSSVIAPMSTPAVDAMISLPDMDVQSLPVNLSGNGSQRTESFSLTPGTISFEIWNDAPGNLEVWLLYNGQLFDRLLENGVITEVPVTEEIVTGGTYFLDVKGDGEWRISVSLAESDYSPV
jgi:hypothetical protein